MSIYWLWGRPPSALKNNLIHSVESPWPTLKCGSSVCRWLIVAVNDHPGLISHDPNFASFVFEQASAMDADQVMLIADVDCPRIRIWSQCCLGGWSISSLPIRLRFGWPCGSLRPVPIMSLLVCRCQMGHPAVEALRRKNLAAD